MDLQKKHKNKLEKQHPSLHCMSTAFRPLLLKSSSRPFNEEISCKSRRLNNCCCML